VKEPEIVIAGGVSPAASAVQAGRHLALEPAVGVRTIAPEACQVRVLVEHVQQPAVRIALQALQAVPWDPCPANCVPSSACLSRRLSDIGEDYADITALLEPATNDYSVAC